MFTDNTEYIMTTAFNEYVVNLVFASYVDNRSLAVQAVDVDDGCLVTTLTTNLSNGKADRTKQYVDTNNCPWHRLFSQRTELLSLQANMHSLAFVLIRYMSSMCPLRLLRKFGNSIGR